MARKKKVQVWLYRCTDDGLSYLLLKRPTDWHSGEAWQPVTGGVKKGEAPLAGARREVAEETGLTELGDALDTELACLFAKKEKKYQEYIFAFSADQGEVELSSEHAAYAWLDYEVAMSRMHYAANRAGMAAVHALLNQPAWSRDRSRDYYQAAKTVRK